MPTEYHDLPTPDDDVPYAEALAEAIEILDRRLLLAGTLDDRPDPDPENAGLWFLDVEGSENDDAEAVLYACRPTGEWKVVDLPIATDLSTVPQTDDHFVVTATWSGENRGGEWVADITGSAVHAEEVPTATTASEAHLIGGLDGTEFTPADAAVTVNAQWRYTERPTYEGGVTCSGGVVGLPGYTENEN